MRFYGMSWREVWEDTPLLVVTALHGEIERIRAGEAAMDVVVQHGKPDAVLESLKRQTRRRWRDMDVTDTGSLDALFNSVAGTDLERNIVTVRGGESKSRVAG